MQRLRHATPRPRPARARRARRRARLLHRDLPRRRLGGRGRARPTSCRTTTRARGAARCAACTSRRTRARASSCAAPAAACSTSSSTCAAARPRSASGRASSSTTSTAASCASRSASATASACSPRPPTSSTSARATTTPATESGIRFDDPDVGVEWPDGVELLFSERDRDAPRLADIADLLPFRYDMTRDGRFAPSPTGDAAPGQPAHRAARLAVRPHGRRPLPRAHRGPRPRPRAGRRGRAPAADLRAIGLDWDGEVVRQSDRLRRLRGRARAPARRGPRLPVLLHPRRDPRGRLRAARPAARGRLPGHLPRLTEAERRRKRAGGRPPALRVRADGARVAFNDRLHGAQEGVVDDFVLRRNDGAPAYNLAVVVDDAGQGIGEVVRGDDLLDSTPRQLFLAGLLGLPAPRTRTCRSCSGRTATGSPSATARSRSTTSTPRPPSAGWRHARPARGRHRRRDARRVRPRCAPRTPTRWAGRRSTRLPGADAGRTGT